MNATIRVGLIVGVFGLCGVLLLANAGPLAPTDGPVSPTGRTLDEIYGRIDDRCCGSCGNSGPWKMIAVTDFSPTGTQIVEGSGLLHAVALDQTTTVAVQTGTPRVVIARLSASSSAETQVYTLNTPYENGIWLSEYAQGSKIVSLLYRPDAP